METVGCGAFRLDFDGGLGGEAEETALFLPVMRQVFAQPGRDSWQEIILNEVCLRLCSTRR